jgi:hypothetical protein
MEVSRPNPLEGQDPQVASQEGSSLIEAAQQQLSQATDQLIDQGSDKLKEMGSEYVNGLKDDLKE